MEDRHRLAIEITGDASRALQAIAEVKAALASLRDKTVTINIVTNGAGAATRGLGDVSAASRGAARAADEHARASTLAGERLSEHTVVAEQAGRSMRGLGDDSGRAVVATRAIAAETERANESLRQMEVAGRPIRQTSAETVVAAVAAGVLAGEVSHASQAMVSAGSSSEVMGRELVTVERSATNVASGMRDVAGATVRVSSGAGGATRPLSSIDDEFNRIVHSSGLASSGLGDFASSARRAGGDAGGTIPPIDRIGGALGGAGDNAGRAGRSFGQAAGSMGMLSRVMYPAAIAAVVSEVGMLALTAGTAGVGVLGVAEVMRSSEPLMAATRQTMRAFNGEFREMAGAAARAGLPAMAELKSEARGLGHELASIGVGHIGQVVDGVSTLTRSATNAVRNLEPAIDPSINALTSLGQAVIDGIGNSAPAITRFADSITRNQGGIQGLVEGTISAAATFGSVVSDVAGAAGYGAQYGGTGAAFGFGQMLRRMAPEGLRQFSDQVDQSLGYTDTPQGPTLSSGTKFGQIMHALGATGVVAGQAIGDIFSGQIGTPESAARLHQSGDELNRRVGALFGGGAPPPPPPGGGAVDPAAQLFQQYQQRYPTGPGSSAGLPSPAVAQQLSQAMQQTRVQSDAAKQSLQELGPAASSSLNQAGSAAQTGGAGVQQHMQSMAQSVRQAPPQIQAAATQIPQAVQQGVQQAPPSMTQPVHQMVRQAVTDVQPTASSGGSQIGQSMTSGAGEGVTKTETKTLTIIRQWIEKIIDVGASALDAHSPSRVFVALGQSIPDGLSLGVQANSGKAVSATQQAMARVVQGAATQLGSGQAQLGARLAQAVTPDPYARPPAAQTRPFDLSRDNAYRRDREMALSQSRVEAEQRNTNKAQDDAEKARKSRYSEQTQKRIEQQKAEHNARAAELRARREQMHDDARYASLYGWDAAHQRRQQLQQDATKQMQQQATTQAQMDSQMPAAPSPGNAKIQQQINESVAKDRARQQGQVIGQAIPQGVAQGIQQGQGVADESARKMAQKQQEELKKKWGIHSPSTVASDIAGDVVAGMSDGFSSAITTASDGIRGVASDRGLQNGYSYGRSMVTGIDSVLKRDLFQTVATPQIDSPQAKAWLGAMGFLGPAGSGASIWKSPLVTLGGSSSGSAPRLNATINVVLDGQPVRAIAQEVVDVSWDDLRNEISLQRG